MSTKKKWIIGICTVITLAILITGVYLFYKWYRRNKQIIHDSSDAIPETDTTDQSMTPDTDYRGNATLTLGLQNNNPGNLRDNGDHWQGLDPDQRTYYGFLRFATLKYGIRANIINISNLIKTYGSIQAYITAYAPPSDGNDTQDYINWICQQTGLSPSTVPALDYPTLKMLIVAHFQKENGLSVMDKISDSDLDKGFALTPYLPVAA